MIEDGLELLSPVASQFTAVNRETRAATAKQEARRNAKRQPEASFASVSCDLKQANLVRESASVLVTRLRRVIVRASIVPAFTFAFRSSVRFPNLSLSLDQRVIERLARRLDAGMHNQ